VIDAFFSLVEHGTALLTGEEMLFASFSGEESDFVRWNGGHVRQAMTISQGHVSLSLTDGKRKHTSVFALTGTGDTDRARAGEAIATMRSTLPLLPEDPYLLLSTEPARSERTDHGALPTPNEAIATIFEAAEGTDLVGIYASGPIRRGFASSIGHRHFHEVNSLQFDFSLYERADKAVNRSHSTATWNAAELRACIAQAKETLERLRPPSKTIAPGRYRAYLSPAALWEIIGMLNWGGVSEKAVRTKTSCLEKLVTGELALSPKLSLLENTREGLAPAFDEDGFPRPPIVNVIREGRHGTSLAGPRTAKEYGIAQNADAEERLRSAEMLPGTLATADALKTLGTGIYVGNLWYLNFSDPLNGRLTGMTRFATFWVEKGEIVAPLDVMRFDDTLYRLLGSELVELTREREWMLSTQSYGQRSVETARLPGVLIGDMTFTL
jgi:predicted Zn-dependent protease